MIDTVSHRNRSDKRRQANDGVATRLNTALRITVLGSGAWGSALASLARRNDQMVTMWSRSSGMSLADAVASADIILSAISMKGVRSVANQLKELNLPSSQIIITATKGLEPETNLTPSQIWQSILPKNPIVVLSGPNLSKEIEQGLPATTVMASRNELAAQTAQNAFASDKFRVYINHDPIGTELGGTLKNVMAIAAGICDGLELGVNAKSALIARSLPEMIRIGQLWDASPETFVGLSGLGDLLATCSGALSRNYRVGFGLAQGHSLDQVIEDLKSTAEGVNTTRVLAELARKEGLDLPISRHVYRVIQGEITPAEAVDSLMGRTPEPENIMPIAA
jgi:glycerol-3-phosphate dehydrogenase (NAD(P)+)